MSVSMKSIPAELFLLHQSFVVEESLAVIRHDLRNRLGAIRNANFYVRRKLQKLVPDLGTLDPRLPEFLALIATEVDSTEQIVQSRLPAPQDGELVAAAALAHRVQQLFALPSHVQLAIEATTDQPVRIAPDEGALALYCLVENAVDALGGASGRIGVRAVARDREIVVEVEDDAGGSLPERALEAFFTTRTGRMGIGLNIARRIATRWNGKLSLAALDRGTRAALAFRMDG